jgi:hypothetical protein
MLLFRGKFNASIKLSKDLEPCRRLPLSLGLEFKIIA